MAISQYLDQQDMWRLVLYSSLGAFLITTVNSVQARSCIDIASNDKRLACFDAALTCTDSGTNEFRLECFDEVYSVSRPTRPNKPTMPVSVEETDRQGKGETVVESALAAGQIEEKDVGASSEKVQATVLTEAGLGSRQDAGKNFGKKKSFDEPIAYIEAKIVDVMQNARKVDYFRLENGQIWRENGDYRVRYKVGQIVRIEKAILGSYNLRIDGVNKLIKVRRVD